MSYIRFITIVMITAVLFIFTAWSYARGPNYLESKTLEIELAYVEQVLQSLEKDQTVSFGIITQYLNQQLPVQKAGILKIEAFQNLIRKYPQSFMKIFNRQLNEVSNGNFYQCAQFLALIISAGEDSLIAQTITTMNKIDSHIRKGILDHVLNFGFDKEYVNNFASYINSFDDYYTNNKTQMINMAGRLFEQGSLSILVNRKILEMRGASRELEEYISSLHKDYEMTSNNMYQNMVNFKKCYLERKKLIEIFKENPPESNRELLDWSHQYSRVQCNYEFSEPFEYVRELTDCLTYRPEADCEAIKNFVVQNLINNLGRQDHFRPVLFGLNAILENQNNESALELMEKIIDQFDLLSLHRQAYVAYIMAMKSDNNALKEKAVNSIVSSIMGTNEKFNNVEAAIYEQQVYMEDQDMQSNRIEELKYRYEQTGNKYYEIQNKVGSRAQRFAYWVNQIASSPEIKFILSRRDVENSGGDYTYIEKSRVIAQLIQKLWSKIIIDDPDVIEEAQKILSRPENDFGRIAVEAFLRANQGEEVLTSMIKSIQAQNDKNYLKKLGEWGIAKIPPVSYPNSEERELNQVLFDQNVKKYQEYQQQLQQVRFLTASLAYRRDLPEVSMWLRNFFLTKKHLELDMDTELDIILAAFLNNDNDIQEMAYKHTLEKLQDKNNVIKWDQNIFEKMGLFLSVNAEKNVFNDFFKFTSLFTTKCNLPYLKNNLIPSVYHEKNDLIKDIIWTIVDGCLSADQIDDVISSSVEKSLLGNIPDLEQAIKNVNQPEASWFSLSKGDIEILEKLFTIASVDIPKMRKTMFDALTYLSLYPNQSLLGRLFFVGLTQDGLVKDFVIDLIQKRMKGKDQLFNQTLGKIYKTQKSKEEYFFLQVLYSSNYNLLSNQDILNLLLTLNFDYELIKEVVEREAQYRLNYRPSVEAEIAQRYVKAIKGEDYLNQVLVNDQSKNFYMVINGGYSPTSNDEYQEVAIESFDRFLFHEEAVVLNAGGPMTLLASVDRSGTQLRDADGIIKLRESTYPKMTLKAVMKNINAVVDRFVKEKPQKVSLVFIDHGGPEGMALWGERMDVSKQRAYQDKFDKNTVIQTFFSACHAGSNLVAAHRAHPQQTANMFEFLEFHYPLNRCALGISMHDEVSYSFGVGKTDAAESKWTEIFKVAPLLTLSNFQRILSSQGVHNGSSDGKVSSTPVLTSDYFIDDIAKILCLEKLKKAQGLEAPNINSPFYVEILPDTFNDNLNAKSVEIIEEITSLTCGDQHAKEMSNFEEGYAQFKLWYSKSQSLINIVTVKFIKENKPEIYLEYTEYLKAIELLKAQFLSRDISSEDSEKLFQLRDNPPVSYSQAKASVEKGTLFNKQFNEIFIQILESKDIVSFKNGEIFGQSAMYTEEKGTMQTADLTFNKEEIDFLRKLFPHCLKSREQCLGHNNMMGDLFNHFYYHAISVQSKRQVYLTKYRGKLRLLIEQLLDDPYLMSIRRRYESIHQCENLPFN